MKLKSSAFKLSLILTLLTAGCAVIDNRGHKVDPDQLAKIKVGSSNKEQVLEVLGTPSFVSTFGNKTWFYMSEITQTRAFFSPTVLKSNVTRIEFNDQGYVVALDSLTEKDKQVVSHIRRTTPTSGHEFSAIEQLFGNVGRFNGKDPDMDRGR